ncbi:thioesterase family protein [Chelatococcus reniformis]|uniref:Acyl-CoA thioesterase n=1 Tax=Chelatococcus reniformis TaxID=1494448 RepID=A0A916TWG8_9HYPH|nr:thioesterase family protein [Chelatococcus reniformis]GGC46810.1 acyl-CoA thioesterase [Chelatococcus reniformis]
MTPISTLLASLTPAGSGFAGSVSEDWQQGRTTYGGLSAALCVEAALRANPGLPPLRSAQFSFVGPAGGSVSMVPTVLRQGKSAAFIGVDLAGEQGLATRAMLTFGASRTSRLAYARLQMPEVPGPDRSPSFFGDAPGPTFARHFEFRSAGAARPLSGAATPEYLIWLRHRDTEAGNGLAALIALADAPPPAAIAMLTEFAPISTMTWLVDMLSDTIADHQEWRLIRCRCEAVADGYATQEIAVWSQAGQPLMLARQTIAVFA